MIFGTAMNDNQKKKESIIWLESNGHTVKRLGGGFYSVNGTTMHRTDLPDLVFMLMKATD